MKEEVGQRVLTPSAELKRVESDQHGKFRHTGGQSEEYLENVEDV